MWTVHFLVPRILLQSLQSVIMVLANNIIHRQTHTSVWSIESDIPVKSVWPQPTTYVIRSDSCLRC